MSPQSASDYEGDLSRAAGVPFAQLLEDLRDGKDAAWQIIYRELAPVITGYLRGQRAPGAEDLTGEVFFNVVRDLHQFDGSEAQFRSWVFTIAHHRLIDERRKRQRRPADATEDGTLERAVERQTVTADAADEALETLTAEEIGVLLADLTDEQREALLLRLVGGLTISEIGKVMGKRSGAVKQLQRRGINALREKVAGGAYPLGPDRALTEAPPQKSEGDPSTGGLQRGTDDMNERMNDPLRDTHGPAATAARPARRASGSASPAEGRS